MKNRQKEVWMRNGKGGRLSGLRAGFVLLAFLVSVSLACSVSADVLPDTGLLETQPPRRVIEEPDLNPSAAATQVAIPMATVSPGNIPAAQTAPEAAAGNLTNLYQAMRTGVVSIFTQVQARGVSETAAGSGFLVDNQGHVVTNNHVIANASQVLVVFYNGVDVEAQVIGTDDDSDLAVLLVEEIPEGVSALPLGDSNEVEVGEWVVAIGNPFGVGVSMSVGIISAVERAIPSGMTPFQIPLVLQTDAAINPGNSGGPLISVSGQVVGVNAQIATGGGTSSSGVGFAIPVNIVRQVVPVLIEQGEYIWPWLGASGGPVTLPLREQTGIDVAQGAYIADVIGGSPAEEAGLQSGDVIIEADGNTVTDFNDLLADLAFKNPGEEMEITVLRNGEQVQLTVTLGSRPGNFTDFSPFQQP